MVIANHEKRDILSVRTEKVARFRGPYQVPISPITVGLSKSTLSEVPSHGSGSMK